METRWVKTIKRNQEEETKLNWQTDGHCPLVTVCFSFLELFPLCCWDVCKSSWAYGCGFVNHDSMLWNGGSGASSFFAELWSLVCRQEGGLCRPECVCWMSSAHGDTRTDTCTHIHIGVVWGVRIRYYEHFSDAVFICSATGFITLMALYNFRA